MSDDKPIEKLNAKDQEILDLLDLLDADSAPSTPDLNAYLDVVGELPYGLEPLEVRPEVKRSLMARVESDSTQTGDIVGFPQAAPGRLVALERRARWFMPMAAVLAIALIGVAALQFRRLEEQRLTISALSSQLERVEADSGELAEARRQLTARGSQVRMLTTRGAEFCVLKPYGERPAYPAATATMVISSDRGQWYLVAEGLEACEGAGCYQLWFLTDAETIRAASFDGGAEGRRIELTGSPEVLPMGLTGIAITREAEPDPREPGDPILFADQVMTLL